jgi:hypothetical protein
LVGKLDPQVGEAMRKDPLEEALEKIGVKLERKDVTPVTQMIASGVGGIAGQVAGSAMRLGGIGTAILGLLGAVVGHVAVTYRIQLEKPAAPRTEGQDAGHGPPATESPMPYSDRR